MLGRIAVEQDKQKILVLTAYHDMHSADAMEVVLLVDCWCIPAEVGGMIVGVAGILLAAAAGMLIGHSTDVAGVAVGIVAVPAAMHSFELLHLAVR